MRLPAGADGLGDGEEVEMILAWYAFVAFAGVCIMFSIAHVIGGWLFERSEPEPEPWRRPEWWAPEPLRLPEAEREPNRLAEMEAVAAAAWGRWSG